MSVVCHLHFLFAASKSVDVHILVPDSACGMELACTLANACSNMLFIYI